MSSQHEQEEAIFVEVLQAPAEERAGRWSTTIIPFHRRQLFLSSRLGKFFHLFGVMVAPVRWNGVFGALAPKTQWNRTGGGFMVGLLFWLFAPGRFRR